MRNSLDPSRLRAALAAELPGEAAKAVMMPRPRRPFDADRALEPAAVLLLLRATDQGVRLPLIVRKRLDDDVHSGQISLPGGRREAGEEIRETALRETREELGIDTDDVEILGTLSPQRIPVSAYEVHPFVGWTEQTLDYVPEPREVHRIFELDLRDLLSEQCRVERESRYRDRPLTIPGWELPQGLLWGATAMILAEFLAVIGAPCRPLS